MIKKLDKSMHIKCDTMGCKNRATYKIVVKKSLMFSGIYLCDECAKNVYTDLGKLFVPKSPTNVLKKKSGVINESRE